MADFRIEAAGARDAALDQLDELLTEMYAYMGRHGLRVPLAEGGVAKLRRAMESSIGRTGMVVLAKRGEVVVGFAHGMLRLTPDYLGGGIVGFVGHTFVQDSCRGQGLGARMFEALQSWFVAKGALSVELQVLTANEAAIRFWELNGFSAELLQMRKPLTDRHV